MDMTDEPNSVVEIESLRARVAVLETQLESVEFLETRPLPVIEDDEAPTAYVWVLGKDSVKWYMIAGDDLDPKEHAYFIPIHRPFISHEEIRAVERMSV